MNVKFALVALVVLGSAGVGTPASALPNGLPHVNEVSNVEQVRWVCNPWGRCWWRPNYYGYYGYGGGPRYYGGWGRRHYGRRPPLEKPFWRQLTGPATGAPFFSFPPALKIPLEPPK